MKKKSKLDNSYQGAYVKAPSGKAPSATAMNFDFASMYPSFFSGMNSKSIKEYEQEMMEKDILDKLDKLGFGDGPQSDN